MEITLGIIKPDSVKAKNSGKIIDLIEQSGLEIIAIEKVLLTKAEAEIFYSVHKERPFYDSLTTFMSSGAIIPMVIQGENAIALYRKIMGATDPSKSDEGTIRKLYGSNIEHNAIHGSDAAETAKSEIMFFFPEVATT